MRFQRKRYLKHAEFYFSRSLSEREAFYDLIVFETPTIPEDLLNICYQYREEDRDIITYFVSKNHVRNWTKLPTQDAPKCLILAFKYRQKLLPLKDCRE
jgi:hypothetical protein